MDRQTDKQTDRQQDVSIPEESSGPRTQIHNMAEALRRGLKSHNQCGKGVSGYPFLRMGRCHSTGLKPGSLVPGQEARKRVVAGYAAISTHIDVNSLPRRDTLAPGVC